MKAPSENKKSAPSTRKEALVLKQAIHGTHGSIARMRELLDEMSGMQATWARAADALETAWNATLKKSK